MSQDPQPAPRSFPPFKRLRPSILLLASISLHTAIAQQAASPNTFPPPVHLTAEQDHQRTMDLLSITTLRPGRSGNPDAPNAANYDESKANPVPDLPDPLILNNGKKVTSAKIWWNQRRPEIVEFFDREIYGRVPKNTPKVNWEVTATKHTTNGDVPVTTKTLAGHVDNSSYPLITVDIQLELTTPDNATGPVPVIMEFGFIGPFPRRPGAATTAAAAARPNLAAAGTRQRLGLRRHRPHQHSSRQRRRPHRRHHRPLQQRPASQTRRLGSPPRLGLGSKPRPRLLRNRQIRDARQVGIEGHSRYGKATLVTMAYDQRFAIAYVSSSGEGGAKLNRRDFGEIVENVAATNEYHWMAGNFLKYAGPLQWKDLPVDAHELIALCAPRPVFISGGATKGDGWVDAKGMFMAAAARRPRLHSSRQKRPRHHNLPARSKPHSSTATSPSASTAAATPPPPTGPPSSPSPAAPKVSANKTIHTRKLRNRESLSQTSRTVAASDHNYNCICSFASHRKRVEGPRSSSDAHPHATHAQHLSYNQIRWT